MTTRNSVCSLQVADERGESVAQNTNQSSNLSGSCASFHHRANLSRSCTFFTKLWSYHAYTLLFFHQHANLLGSCIVFHHRASSSCIFITNFWTYQAYALLFSPPCKLSRLMHLFCHHLVNLSSSCSCFHHRVNLSNSCTILFSSLWTYQTHALFFHHRVNLSSSCTPFSPPCELISLMHSFSDCWHSDLYPTHARTLWFYETEWKKPGNTATTKTMWYRNLAWSTRLGKISNQINLHYSSICKA